jgi:soluble lytic murein transglycosylase-like protein
VKMGGNASGASSRLFVSPGFRHRFGFRLWFALWRRFGVALLLTLFVLASKSVAAQVAATPTSFDTRFEALQATASAAEPDKSADTAPPDADPPSLAAPSPVTGPAGYRLLSALEAKRSGLAPEIADAVMQVESGYNPAAIGTSGEIGLMQILPSTARMLGFTGTDSDLAVPATNIHYGVMYLAQAWQLAGGDLCTAVMKYRAGHGETRFSYRSVDYCLAVRAKLFARGFPVTGSVPVATFGDAPGPACRKCLGHARIGDINLAALNTRLSTLVVQVRGGH